MDQVVLLDTSVLVDVERKNAEAVAFLARLESERRSAISVVTEMELIVGCRSKNELRSLQQFIRRFQVYMLTPPIAQAAVDLLRQYRLSHGLLVADALIAATALSIPAPLVTANRKDFDFIGELEKWPYL